jgi:hypothetical protein
MGKLYRIKGENIQPFYEILDSAPISREIRAAENTREMEMKMRTPVTATIAGILAHWTRKNPRKGAMRIRIPAKKVCTDM